MWKKNKSIQCFLAFVVCMSVFLTGCGSDANVLLDTQISMPVQLSSENQQKVYQQDYLSKDVCVIQKNANSATDAALTAPSVLLVNDTTQELLFAQNVHEKRYPASITKIVTALLVLKQGNLDDLVIISYDASHITEYGAKLCGFQEGDQISLRDLLHCLLIYSGNDAGVAIAEHLAGSVEAFADLMNQEMKMIGASNTHFVNPHGLHDDKQYTTAYDLYLIFHELLQYELFCEIIQMSEYMASWTDASGVLHEFPVETTDKYLTGAVNTPEGLTILGGKTGTTIKAGSCLILYSQDSEYNNYISVILKADSSASLYTQMNHLLGYVKRG